jgi:hypothetical protein
MKQKPLFIDDPKVVAFDWVLFIPVLLLIAVQPPMPMPRPIFTGNYRQLVWGLS